MCFICLRILWVFGTYISLSWFAVGRILRFMTLNSPQNVALPPWWRMYQCFLKHCSSKCTKERASVTRCCKLQIICFSQPGQGQHEDDHADKARQQSGSSSTHFEETIISDSVKSFPELLVLHFFRSTHCKYDLCPPWLFATLLMSPQFPVLSRQK